MSMASSELDTLLLRARLRIDVSLVNEAASSMSSPEPSLFRFLVSSSRDWSTVVKGWT